MARVTVEDCLHDLDNLFQLVLVASRRARQIYSGSDARVPEDGDKPTVLALREIAAGKVGAEVLDEKIISADFEMEELEQAQEPAQEQEPEQAQAQEQEHGEQEQRPAATGEEPSPDAEV